MTTAVGRRPGTAKLALVLAFALTCAGCGTLTSESPAVSAVAARGTPATPPTAASTRDGSLATRATVASLTPMRGGTPASVGRGTPARQAAPPPPGVAIAPDNAARVGEVARWGAGVPVEVRFSPDGRWFAAGSRAGIALYDAATLTEAWFFPAPAPVTSIALSPDGAMLAALLSDGTARLWRIVDGAPLHVLPGHGTTNAGQALAFSPDGGLLAVAGADGLVWLWRLADGAPLGTLAGHRSPVLAMAFAPDSASLITADRGLSYAHNEGRPMAVRVWRVADRASLRTIAGPENVQGVALAAGGTLLATAFNQPGGGGVRLWRLEADGLRPVLFVSNAAAALAISPDGAILAVGSTGEARLWRVADGAPLQILRGHPANVDSLAFGADGATLATASRDGTLRHWRVGDGVVVASMGGFGQAIASVAWAPDGTVVAAATGAGGKPGLIQLWRARDGAPLRVLAGHDGGVNAVAFSSDGALLASAGLDWTVRLWRVADGALLHTLERYDRDAEAGLAFAPDGRTLATATRDRTVQLWRLDGVMVTPLRALAVGELPVHGMAFSPDGALLAASSGKTIRLWRATDGAVVRVWEVPPLRGDTPHSRVAFTPDGATLLTLSRDVVRLWALGDGALLRTIPLDASASALGVAPNGRVLAVNGKDGTVQLWSLPDGGLLNTLRGHASGVLGVAFSPDGTLLISGSGDGTLRLWAENRPAR